MTPTPSVYSQTIVSPRSRRLRTIAAVILVIILVMSAYGVRVLMPLVKRSADAARREEAASAARQRPADNLPASTGREHRLRVSSRTARIIRFQVIFTYGYWTIWTMLVLTLLLLSWMDLREVSRNYISQRKLLFQAAIDAETLRSKREIQPEPELTDADQEVQSAPILPDNKKHEPK